MHESLISPQERLFGALKTLPDACPLFISRLRRRKRLALGLSCRSRVLGGMSASLAEAVIRVPGGIKLPRTTGMEPKAPAAPSSNCVRQVVIWYG